VSGWRAVLAAARAEHALFERARATPRASQEVLLAQIVAANSDTDFGRAHGFARIHSIDDFRARVPIRPYEGLRPWLDRVAAGETDVLTSEAVIAFEETGGSTAGGKLIPYTASSLEGFRAAVLPWLADLAGRRPGAFVGKAYVSVSPATRAPRVIGGIPVGMASEGAYLGEDLVPALLEIMAVPASVAHLSNVDEWRLATLTALVRCPDLTLISVWSPTFLVALLDALPRLAEPIMRALHDETERARDVRTALARSPIDTALLWPRLDTVSAWADGSSRPYARQLQDMLPHATLEPKGLLATEGAVTTPCSSAPRSPIWPVPALTSAVLEFIDNGGKLLLCDELRAGESYRVVMTNAGGFYRYDLGDRLLCHGYEDTLPLLEFIGRDVASDLVGEKLSEPFVSAALTLVSATACLAPRAAARPHYVLLIDSSYRDAAQSAAATIEQRLRCNPQYDYARKIGQLGPVTCEIVDHLLERHLQLGTRRGRRLADIKPPALITDATTVEALINPVDSGHIRLPAAAFIPIDSGG
jgi:GH3 auxin-responsive promoter